MVPAGNKAKPFQWSTISHKKIIIIIIIIIIFIIRSNVHCTKKAIPLWFWSNLLKKSLMENFVLCSVLFAWVHLPA